MKLPKPQCVRIFGVDPAFDRVALHGDLFLTQAQTFSLAPPRREAIMKMRWALAEFLVEGVDTNIDFQLSLLHNKEFTEGDYDIGFLAWPCMVISS